MDGLSNIQMVIAVIDDEIETAIEQLNDCKASGDGNSFAAGWESGVIRCLRDLKEFIENDLKSLKDTQ